MTTTECAYCGQAILPGDPVATTAGGTPAHTGCHDDYETDRAEAHA